MIALLLALLLAAEDSFLAQGKKAFDEGRYEEAIAAWQKANGNQCEVPFYIGLAQFRLQRANEAIVQFSAAVECDKTKVPPKIALAEAYNAIGNTNRALSAYEETLKQAPDSVEALRGIAAIYANRQQNDQLVPILERLVKLAPRDAMAHANLGAAYAATSRMEPAETEFQKALQIDPKNASALTGLGNYYLKAERTKEAIPLLKQAASVEKKAYEPLFLLGTAYSAAGQWEKAEDAFQRALALKGQESEIYYRLAAVYGHLNRDEERKAALRRFQELKNRTQQNQEAAREASRLVLQANSRIENGDMRGALELLTKAHELSPGDEDILFRLAGVQFDLKEYDAARRNVEQAVERVRGEWSYYYLLGLIEKATNRFVEARRALETAVKLNTQAADAYNHLGDIAMREERFAQAVENFQKAANIDSREPSFRANLEAARRALEGAGQKAP